MLKGVPALLGADALWALAAMGHGDRLAIVDRNYPARTTSSTGRVIELAGVTTSRAAAAITELFPLDAFQDPCAWKMVPNASDPHDGTGLVAHDEMERVLAAGEGRAVALGAIARDEFYAEARRCFVTFVTADDRPYACFVLAKGVL